MGFANTSSLNLILREGEARNVEKIIQQKE